MTEFILNIKKSFRYILSWLENLSIVIYLRKNFFCLPRCPITHDGEGYQGVDENTTHTQSILLGHVAHTEKRFIGPLARVHRQVHRESS